MMIGMSILLVARNSSYSNNGLSTDLLTQESIIISNAIIFLEILSAWQALDIVLSRARLQSDKYTVVITWLRQYNTFLV